MLGYLPASMWMQLFAGDTWVDSQSLLIGFVQSLGGRILSEPTYKCIAPLCLLVTDRNAQMLPSSAKQRSYQKLKSEWKQRVKHLTKPPCLTSLCPCWIILPCSSRMFVRSTWVTFSTGPFLSIWTFSGILSLCSSSMVASRRATMYVIPCAFSNSLPAKWLTWLAA